MIQRLGAALVDYRGKPLTDFLAVLNYTTPMYFGAIGDGVADDTVPVQSAIASGQPVYIDKPYKVKNLNGANAYIQFTGAGKFIGMLGERDNIMTVVSSSSFTLINPVFDKGLSAWAVDGDFGNALRLGSYRNNSSALGSLLVENVYIKDMLVNNTTTAFNSQAVEILGNVQDVWVDGLEVVGSGAGIICHWGGDVGDAGAHDSIVSFSHHPRRLKLDRLHFHADASGNKPNNTIIISACYDVEVNFTSDGIGRTVWVMPGDVYNEVAVTRDKNKVCTGIRVNGHVTRPDVTATDAPVTISGMPATQRTTQPTFWGRDNGSYMDVVVDVNITCDDVVYSRPMYLQQGCKGVTARVNKSGGSRSSSHWVGLDYNEGCSGEFSGDSVIVARLRGDTNSDFTFHATRHNDGARSTSERGIVLLAFRSGALAVQGTITAGETTVPVIAAADGVIFNGGYIMSAGVPVAKVQKSILAKAGVVTNLTVTPLTASLSGSVSVDLPNEGTTIRGDVNDFMYSVQSTNTWGTTFSLNSTAAYRGGLLLDGDYCRSTTVRECYFQDTGVENAAPLRTDVHLTASLVDGFRLVDNDFDAAEKNPNVNTRLSLSTSNHKGVMVRGNRGTPTTSGISFSINPSTAVSTGANGRVQAQVYGNDVEENDTPIGTHAGFYLGNAFRGLTRENAAPTVGRYAAGDVLDYYTPSATKRAVLCTVSGVPGTWIELTL